MAKERVTSQLNTKENKEKASISFICRKENKSQE